MAPSSRMNPEIMLFDNWAGLVRVLVVGTAGYLALILILRISGKRTLTKLNAFDFVVTVALGSTLASVILSKSVALAEGVLALALLVLLQFLIAWLSVRSQRFEGLIKAEPVLLVRKGAFLDAALRRERITREEVLAAVRAQGSADIARVSAVVLETDGSISVIQDVGNESTVLPGARRSDRQNPPQDDYFKSAAIKEGDKGVAGTCNSIRSKDFLACHVCIVSSSICISTDLER